MALYTFHMCNCDGFSISLEVRELPYDSATYPVAGQLLEEHLSADHIAVWMGAPCPVTPSRGTGHPPDRRRLLRLAHSPGQASANERGNGSTNPGAPAGSMRPLGVVSNRRLGPRV